MLRRVIAPLTRLLSVPAGLAGQIRASERANVSQTIDGTVITVDYARPRVRGREKIFGSQVTWKEVWTPGANYATTLETSRNIMLDGHPVPKGKYSMWLVVEKEAPWLLILDPRHRRYHTAVPDSTAEQVRYQVEPKAGPSTEVLTFSFPDVKANGATLRLRWDTIQLDFAIRVEPSHRLEIARSEVEQYLGAYRFKWKSEADSAAGAKVTLTHERDRLMGRWDPEPWEGAGSFALVRIAPDWFQMAFLEKGEVYDVLTEMVFEFANGQGPSSGFEIRDEGDKVIGSASRGR